MSDKHDVEVCSSCQEVLHGNYCAACGTQKSLKRIDGAYVARQVSTVLNFDKGFFYTIRELLVRPGGTVSTFILTDRNRLVKPIVFIIICSLIYTLTQRILLFEDGYINYAREDGSMASVLFGWLSNNYGYTNILISIFTALWIKLFYWKRDVNFFEVLILLCFVMGMCMLIFTLFGIVDSFTELKAMDVGSILGVGYFSWAVGQFFGKRAIFNYVKALLSFFLGLISFSLIILLLGRVIDFFV